MWHIKLKNLISKRLAKYITSGGLSFVVEFSVFAVVVYAIGASSWVGQIISYIVALLANFTLLKYWTFTRREGSRTRKQFTLYLILVVANLFVTTGLMYMFTELSVEPIIAKAIVVAAVVCWNYFFYNRVIFVKKSRD